MKYPRPHSLAEVAELIGAQYIGDAAFEITGQNEIHVVEPGDIVFVDHPKYYDKALNSAATTILINKEVECPTGKALLISDDPFRDFNKLTQHFLPFEGSGSAIHPSASIGKGTVIEPNVTIGPNVKIGENCILHAGVVVRDGAIIGNEVILHPNVVIGGEAFYYKKRDAGYDKLLSGGNICIEDRVELGAGTTIDKGVSGITTIGEGTKIDNLCHVGHDTVIGKHCLFAAHTGIAGCTTVGDHVTLWGRVGVTSGIHIGDHAVVLACSCVSKSLEGGKNYFGVPAEEAKSKWREMAALRRLPELISKLK